MLETERKMRKNQNLSHTRNKVSLNPIKYEHDLETIENNLPDKNRKMKIEVDMMRL